MNRIDDRFARLRHERKKGFVVYLGAGDPDLETTRRLALACDRVGVDILELGVPFSDPLADGLVNQLAAQRGLDSGTTPARVLQTVADLRRDSQIPIVLYLYYNLIHRAGLGRFVREAARVGVDGLLVLDLPPDESGECDALMKEAGLCRICLVAPTTPEARLEQIIRPASGFIYYVSREGVTGMQSGVATDLATRVAAIRRHTGLPVAIGFGVSNSAQVKAVAACADAVVVGSVVVDQIARSGRSPELVDRVSAFVAELADAVKSL